MNDLEPLTIDVIRSLRRRGLGYEASRAISSFRESLDRQAESIRKEIQKHDRAVLSFYGICHDCRGKAVNGRYRCRDCLKKRREANRVSRERKKGGSL